MGLIKKYFVEIAILAALIVLAIVASSRSATAADLGLVLRATDGDTVVLRDGRVVNLRGVDAPELAPPQCFSRESQRWLNYLLKGRVVELTDVSEESENEVYAFVTWDRVDINALVVQSGFAWVNKRQRYRASWVTAQDQAKQKRLGLWRMRNCIPPWDWRDGVRSVRASSAVELVPATAVPPRVPSVILRSGERLPYR